MTQRTHAARSKLVRDRGDEGQLQLIPTGPREGDSYDGPSRGKSLTSAT